MPKRPAPKGLYVGKHFALAQRGRAVYTEGMKPLSRSLLLLSALALCAPARAGVVAGRLPPALELAQINPQFRQSLIAQIELAGSLSASAIPSLTPMLTASPTPADPWKAQAAALVGAYVAQPAAAAAARVQLRQALGDASAEVLQQAAARFEVRRSADSGLDAQLRKMTAGLDFTDAAAVQSFAAGLYDFARSRPEGLSAPAVSVPEGPSRAPLVALSRAGERPAMSAAELEAYVEKNKEVSPRGLVRVTFASGDYRSEYDAALRRLGVDRVVIKTPSRGEIDALAGDVHDFRLITEKVRWVMTTRTMAEHEAMLADNKQGGKGSYASQFRKALAASENVKTKLGVLTIEDFERWYDIYEQEIVGVGKEEGGRVGRRAVDRDMARKLGAEKLSSEGWYGLFYYNDAGELVGGDIYKAVPERGLFVNGYAAYRPELKSVNPAVRAFEVGMRLAREQGYKAFSFGMDTNIVGYDYNVGLMANKAGFLLQPFPESDFILSKMLDTAKIAAVVNKQGQSGGYGYFGVKGPIVDQYRASLDAGAPKKADELLGRTFQVVDGTVRSANGLSSPETSVFWHYQGNATDPLRTPRGIQVEKRTMEPK